MLTRSRAEPWNCCAGLPACLAHSLSTRAAAGRSTIGANSAALLPLPLPQLPVFLAKRAEGTRDMAGAPRAEMRS
jgi:hypothetical protein